MLKLVFCGGDRIFFTEVVERGENLYHWWYVIISFLNLKKPGDLKANSYAGSKPFQTFSVPVKSSVIFKIVSSWLIWPTNGTYKFFYDLK